MKYTLVLLDFDGTLMDTSPGIIKTILYSMNKLGIPVNKNTNLKTVVGPPLQYGFSSIMKLEKSLVPDAINIYRKRYLERGMYDACHYPGTFEFLDYLREEGCTIAVATLKHPSLVRLQTKHFNFDKYLQGVFGSKEGMEDGEKVDIINEALDFFKISPKNTVFIGDTLLDWEGAKKAGVDFIGVGFGCGFQSEKKSHSEITMASSYKDLRNLL